MVSRATSCALLLSITTACVPAATQHSLSPQRGPKATIHANFDGGLVNRQALARFSVDADAHVMVGHLGGDGYVRILYPRDATARSVVRKGKTYSTERVSARHDALPSLYSAHSVRYRHVAARLDSYDGGGNGYFFILASRYPLNFDEISAAGVFDQIEVPDYYDTLDPRLTIKALGDLVANGRPYTLEYATSFRSVDYTNYFDHLSDCRMLDLFGFNLWSYGLGIQPYYYAFGAPSIRNTLGPRGCGSAFSFASLNRRPYAYYASNYTPASPTLNPTQPVQPRGTIRPPWQRRVTPPSRRARSAASAHLPDRINARVEANAWRDRARPSESSRSGGWAGEERRRAAAERRAERGTTRDASPSPSTEARTSTAGRSAERERPVDRSGDRPSSPSPRSDKRDP